MFFIPDAYLKQFISFLRFSLSERKIEAYGSDLITSTDFPNEELLKIIPFCFNGNLSLLFVPWNYRFKFQTLTVHSNIQGEVGLVDEEEWIALSVDKLLKLPFFVPNDLKAICRDYVLFFNPSQPLIHVKYDDFWNVFHSKTIDLPLIPRYKTKITTIVPSNLRTKLLDKYPQVILGISLGNSQLPQKTISMATWIDKRFEACQILVGDSIHRLTLQIVEHLTEIEAKQKAIALGKNYFEHSLPIFQRFRNCRFNYSFTSELENHANFQPYFQQLVQLAENNNKFNAFVQRFTEMFITRNKAKVQENLDMSIKLSRLYLFEELAILACMIEDGWQVLLYPGTLGSAQIAPHGFEGLPEPLQWLVSVSLQLRKRK